jgi:hypothetical protein
MRLSEIKKIKSSLQPYMFQTKPEIQKWLDDNNVRGMINRDLEIESSSTDTEIGIYSNSDSTIDVNGQRVLPVQFKQSINFNLNDVSINSFVGCPYMVLKDFTADNVKVESFKGLPTLVINQLKLNFVGCNFKNLIGISRCKKLLLINSNNDKSQIKSIKGISEETQFLTISCDYSNCLEIQKLMPDIIDLWIMSDLNENSRLLNVFKMKNLKYFSLATKYKPLSKIIVKHLTEGDIIDCQEELIENGYKEYAKL